MEIRDWALRVFGADTLAEKLYSPPGGVRELTDREPGQPIPWARPARPPELQIAPRGERLKFPSPKALYRPDMRIRCLHTFANHELMAVELMAWALLAFPQAESSFRLGLAKILIDEQRHVRLYADHLELMGAPFGSLPVNQHFWRVAEQISSPLDWVCAMHLTFEQANLDHAPMFARLFREVEDEASALVMDTIFRDEISHVRFGSRWLKAYRPEGSSMFETFVAHSHDRTTPLDRARGTEFQIEARRKAGLDEEFIAALESWGRNDS